MERAVMSGLRGQIIAEHSKEMKEKLKNTEEERNKLEIQYNKSRYETR